MDLRSRVTLIEEIEGIGKVMRVVTKGYNEHGEQTNNFNFLFRVKDAAFERYIYPDTFNEILEHHEAKRRLHYERIVHHDQSLNMQWKRTLFKQLYLNFKDFLRYKNK